MTVSEYELFEVTPTPNDSRQHAIECGCEDDQQPESDPDDWLAWD
jgi:hypothetical protein